MPYNPAIENVVGALQAVRDPESTRPMLVNCEVRSFDFDFDLTDYEHLEKPLVEVFNLDSETCAACGYMVGAVNRAAGELIFSSILPSKRELLEAINKAAR